MKILVGIEESEGSKKAAQMAVKLAKGCGGTVTGVFVVPPIPSEWKTLGIDPGKDHIDPSALDKVFGVLKKEAEGAGVTYDTRIFTDAYPSETLLRLVERDKYDCLVLGRRRKTGVRKLILGSVVETVVRNAPCSVVVAK
ncbi:MAG: universal stress protein [Clostridia bacterium]|nr:universal stress protein [Clostridia bacterium]